MDIFGVLTILLFGVVALIFLVECLEQLFAAARRWFARGPKPLAPTFAAIPTSPDRPNEEVPHRGVSDGGPEEGGGGEEERSWRVK